MVTYCRGRKFGARNQFQEPSLEMCTKLHRLAGRYDSPMPTRFLAPMHIHFLKRSSEFLRSARNYRYFIFSSKTQYRFFAIKSTRVAL
jgi:hypothetical protein